MALRRSLLAGLLALAAAAAPAPLPGPFPTPLSAQEGQSFLEAYKAGVEAVQAEDWQRVERSMRTAIAGRAEEADRLIRHLHLRPYVPYFYLGLALAEQGECTGALEAFAESERQGVIGQLADELAVLRVRKTACSERLAAEAEARERHLALVARVTEADRTAASVAALAQDPELADAWERGEPSLATRLSEARSILDTARERLREAGEEGAGRGDDDADPLAEVSDLTRGALAQIEAIRREAELRKAAVVEDRAAAARRTAALLQSGRELLADTRELAAAVPAVGRWRTALEEAVAHAGDAAGDEPVDTLRSLATRLERAAADLRAAAEPPPPALLEAAGAWLRGEPEAVLAALAAPPEGPLFPDARARGHASLLRAAAAFSLYDAGGATDAALLEAARRDAAACHRDAPDLQPPASAFSPRFRAFFAGIEAAPAPASAAE